MSVQWPSIPLGDLLQRSDHTVLLHPETTYTEVTVRMNGKGVVERRRVQGVEIASERRYKASAGQFIISRIDARHGASGLIPDELEGAIVTNDFPLFNVATDRLDAAFFNWMSKTVSFVDLCRRASEGTTNRVRLSEARFKALEILLPPLDEQRRIAARIEELALKIAEAQSLRISLAGHVLALPRALLHQRSSSRTIRVREFAALRPPDVKVEPLEEYHFAGVYSFGRGVFKGQRKVGSEFAYPKLTRLHVGDFVYPKLMAWEGALGIVPVECDGLVVSTEFPVFEIDNEVMLPEIVDTYFRSPEVWPGLSGQSGGTNVRRRRLNPNDFLNLQVPWPDQETQAAIKECVSRVSAIRAIQSETSMELDAMLPSILDKAFKGEF
jgi:type I restriction enzyme, S subunit